jgi:hypothetical protein
MMLSCCNYEVAPPPYSSNPFTALEDTNMEDNEEGEITGFGYLG